MPSIKCKEDATVSQRTPDGKWKVKHPRIMWHRTIAKEREKAGSGSWDQVACFRNIDSGDSTKKSVDNKEGGGEGIGRTP